MGLGITEIIVIFLIVLLFFGAKRLPEVARAMGQATHEFKKAKNDIVNGVTNVVKNANVVLDKNKLLKGLSTETMDNIKALCAPSSAQDVVSFASRKWIPKFKN